MKNIIRSQKTKEAFIKYLKENPQQRFGQALTNFLGVFKVGYTQDGIHWGDIWVDEFE